MAALMVLRKRGKSRMAVIEPYYTYHARQVEEVFQKLPEGIPSHPDWSPDFDGTLSLSLSLSLLSLSLSLSLSHIFLPQFIRFIILVIYLLTGTTSSFNDVCAAIEKALKGGVEGIIIANPNNPTGRVWTKDELQKLYAP